MLLQSRQKMELNVLDSQNLLTEVLFDPVSLSLVIKVIQLYQCFTFDDFFMLCRRFK